MKRNLFRPPESHSYMFPRSPITTEGNRNPNQTPRMLQRESEGVFYSSRLKKASKGVFYSSVGSGATVGYRY